MEYVKILSGAERASMLNSEHGLYVRLCRQDASPGPGWWPVVKVPPKPVPGPGEELAYSYTVRDGAAYKEYFLAPAGQSPSQPRVFSKLKVVAALKAANVWDSVKQYIIDADLYDLYLAAQDFAEDNEYFVQGKAALQQALGWDSEQVEAVLAASVKEGA